MSNETEADLNSAWSSEFLSSPISLVAASETIDDSAGGTTSVSLCGSDAELASLVGDIANASVAGESSGMLLGSESISTGTLSSTSETTSGETANGDVVGDGSLTNSAAAGASSGGSTNSMASGSDSSAQTNSWRPFTLPEGVSFDDVHLPLESLPDRLAFSPTRLESFTETSVTETNFSEEMLTAEGTVSSRHSVWTRLIVTIDQTYVNADQWRMTQSWTKEYGTTATIGDPSNLGAWSSTVRSRTTTFAITVSLGFGVPSIQPITAKFQAAVNAATSSSSFAPSLAPATATVTTPPASTGTPLGPVATVSFTDVDTQTKSAGDAWDNSDTTIGSIDTGSYSGSSQVTASKWGMINEFLVALTGGGIGRTTQAGFAVDQTGTVNFTGQYDQFDADGSIYDAAGASVTESSHPYGSTYSSIGTLPATDAASFLDSTATPPMIGASGRRYEAHGSVNFVATSSTGSYLLGNATVPDGQELHESDISGTTGIYATHDSTVSVTDSLLYDSQTYNPGATYENVALGWNSSASASSNMVFTMDMSLDDADLSASSDTPSIYTPGYSPGTDSGLTLASTTLFPTTTTYSAPSSATMAAAVLPSGGSTCNEAAPSKGKPVINLTGSRTQNRSDSSWLQVEDGGMLGASQNLLSLRSSGNVSTTAQVNWNGLIPTVTVAAVGGGTVTLLMGGKTRFLEPSYVPVSGYDQLIGEREVAMDRGLSLTGSTNFNVIATFSPSAGPAVSGDASASLDHVSFGRNHQVVHRKYQNRTNPGDIDEFWTTQNSINIQRTKFEGDLVNGLSTGSSQTIISEGTTVGSVPPAVPLPAPPSVTFSSRILDGVQLALDIGGLVPVVGEACDLTNVLIHVARGNKAEALISLAAMIPVAGAAVVSGKFATKAGKALANNADKLDEVTAAVNAPVNAVKTVLGHNPAYTELAEQLGARRFNIPTSVWNKMTEAERWAANKKFLDRMIARGDDVILATRADLAKPGSYFAKELEYLLSKGFKISEDGLRLIAPGRP